MSIVLGFLLCLTGILLSLGILLIARLQLEIRMDLETAKKVIPRGQSLARDIIFLVGVAAMFYGSDIIAGGLF
jgi:hypothetical protein